MGVPAKQTTNNGGEHMNETVKYMGRNVHHDETMIPVAGGGREGGGAIYRSIPGDL